MMDQLYPHYSTSDNTVSSSTAFVPVMPPSAEPTVEFATRPNLMTIPRELEIEQ